MASFTTFVAFFLSLYILIPISNARNITATNNTDCSCGYYDASTKELFTESIIVYFNETDTIPDEAFLVESYENQYEKGWNTRFRTGAKPSNVDVGADWPGNVTDSPDFPQALNLYVDPTTPDHLVVGGGIRTKRRDIHYGSFRTYLHSPRASALGSALSMVLQFNVSQSFTMDLMNTDNPDAAWISMLYADEFSDRSLGVNYSVIANETFSPWNYTEYRIDWTKDNITWFIGGKPYRTRTREEDPWLPSAPAPFELKHWSTGDFFSMQGPPASRSVANVGWMRLFFNSTTTADADERSLDRRCKVLDACSVDNMELRGSTPYSEAATVKWKQVKTKEVKRVIALWFCVACISLTVFLLIHSFAKRIPRKRIPTVLESRQQRLFFRSSRERLTADDAGASQFSLPFTPSDMLSPDVDSLISPSATPFNLTRAPSMASRKDVSDDLTVRELVLSTSSSGLETLSRGRIPSGSTETYNYTEKYPSGFSENLPSRYFDAKPVTNRNGKPVLVGLEPFEDDEITPAVKEVVPTSATQEKAPLSATVEKKNFTDEKEMRPITTAVPVPPTPGTPVPKTAGLPEAKKRVDYLAGLVAVSLLLVTGINFCLTFVPASINPGAFSHYASETWARKTIDPYLLNLIWIGPFLMTSTRFLVSSYIRDGNILAMAEKVVGRLFRLMIPITAIVLLEYFLMDCGATKWLEYLASVTWSTWPFTVGFNNFGNFLSEILQLMYLIPNAAPQITFNYCTGVLWIIPVQLQGSWTTLLAVLVIREIKTPYKRFSYYAICILLSWYALSWASYFYLGILLTDLDLTYKWRKYLHARPLAYYPLLLLLAILGIGGLTNDLVTQWTLVNYSAYEYGIHPDPPTGLPIMLTGAAGYPEYFVPKLNGLLFSVGFQAVIELSPAVQKLFSFKLLQYIFPHIFTIYLIHGFIFWSLGAAVCVFLAAHGFAYWLNMLVVAICCYAALIACLPILTPVVETLGKNITANIWRFSHEKPSPRRPTLFPFPSDLFLKCTGNEDDGQGTHETKEGISRDAVGRLSFEGKPVVPVTAAGGMEVGILEGRIDGKPVVDVEGEGLKVVEGKKVEKSRFSE
jgi:hypothetical protein